MDWTLAINRNREALLRIIAAMYALAGLVAGAKFTVLPRHIHRIILRILRPAESSTRRLIIIAARGLVLVPVAGRTAPVGLISSGGAPRNPAFPLIDPLKRFAPFSGEARNAFEFVDIEDDDEEDAFVTTSFPRISAPGSVDPIFITTDIPNAQGPLNAENISRRLIAMTRALCNLNKQAHRLARWKARRDLALLQKSKMKPRRMSPFRPGSPPGMRLRRVHEVDHILRECHLLLLDHLTDSS